MDVCQVVSQENLPILPSASLQVALGGLAQQKDLSVMSEWQFKCIPLRTFLWTKISTAGLSTIFFSSSDGVFILLNVLMRFEFEDNLNFKEKWRRVCGV